MEGRSSSTAHRLGKQVRPRLASRRSGQKVAWPRSSRDPLLPPGEGSSAEGPAHQLGEQESGQRGLVGLPMEEGRDAGGVPEME